MNIEFDAEKDALNREKHGLSLADAVRLNLGEASVVADRRRDHGEGRFQAYSRIAGRLHVPGFHGAVRRRHSRHRFQEGQRERGRTPWRPTLEIRT